MIISLALFLVGCGTPTQAETTSNTQATTEAVTTQATIEAVTTQATTEAIIEETTLSELNQSLMDKIRKDVKQGKIGEDELEDIVTTLCDFLDEKSLSDFLTELRSLFPKEEETTQAESKPVQKESKPAPKETKPAAVQPTNSPEEIPMTMPNPVNTEPTEDPLATEPDPSTYQTIGNTTFEDTPLDSDQSLSPEEEQAINNIQFN